MDKCKVLVPPIKCQGIKTKIVPFIKENVVRDENGTWIEPFVGTGVVAFNIAPKNALLCDKNQYIIALYQGVQNGTITSKQVRTFLEYHGKILEQQGATYYKKMRDEFNKNGENLIVTLEGRLDTTTAPKLDDFLTANLMGVNDLIIDCADLIYVSSAGLRVLLGAQKKMQQIGEMKVINVCEAVMEVFEITGFADILAIE